MASRARNKLAVSASILALSAVAVGAHAQNAPPAAPAAAPAASGLSDIVVTARKQSESMLKVPVTEAAIGAADLERHQINDITSVTSQIAAIRFDQTYGGGGGTLTIRGIGSSTSDDGVDQTVATVFDGLQTSRGTFTKIGFLDLAQVEVLKGPQALFFGKNSPGGVLSLTAATPTSYLTGYVRGGYTTGIGGKQVEGAISGPITDKLRFRLAASYEDDDGWITNAATAGIPTVFGPTLGAAYNKNWSKEFLSRLTVDYKPTSNFTATFRIAGVINRNAGVSSNGEITSCGFATTPTLLGQPDPVNDCNLNYRNVVSPIRPEVRGTDITFPANGVQPGQLDAVMTGLTLSYNAGPITITSVTGYMSYYELENHSSSDSFGFGQNGVLDHWYQFSQELRFVSNFDGPINFSGGFYYDQTHTTEHGPNIIFGLPADTRTPSPACPFCGSFFSYVYDGVASSQSYSAFGQLRWKIFPTLEFDAGARVSHDNETGDVVNSFVNAGPAGFLLGFLEPEGVHVAGKRSYNNVSPEFTLTWTATPDTIVFGSFRTGYKPGQTADPYIVSAGLSAAPGSTEPLFYQTETVHGWEFGFKSELLDRTLRITGAAFTYQYDNLQVSNFNSAAFVLTPLAGNMSTSGGEIDVTWQPIHSLTLHGAVAYTRARWTHFPDVACYAGAPFGTVGAPAGAPICINDPVLGPIENLTGFTKFRSPDWSGNFGFVYELPPISSVGIELSGNVSFVSSYNSQENDSPFAQQPGYALIDAGVKFTMPIRGLTFSIIGKNLSGVKYVPATYDQATDDGSTTVFGLDGPPRTVMFQAGYKF